MSLPQLGSFSSEAFLEQGKSGIKKISDVALQSAKATVQTAAQQLTGSYSAGDGTVDAPSPIARSQDDIDFIQDLYGLSRQTQTPSSQIASAQTPQMENPSQATQQQQELAQTRQKLANLLRQQHNETYFGPVFNRPKQKEEGIAEKLEREDEEKKYEEFEKQQKKPDFALQRAQGRAEMAPGASG